MNGSFMILGVLAFSMVVVSFVAYKMSIRFMESISDHSSCCTSQLTNNSTLEDDVKDILTEVPLNEIKELFYDYLMYDKQIANTYNFINDQKLFILQEFQQMPHAGIIIGYLRDMGFRVEHWQAEIKKFWNNAPHFERCDSSTASGGFTVMIQKMLQIVPKEELHILLRAKARYSKNIRSCIMLLGSPLFIDMCHEITKNPVLNRHFYWAMEAELEVTFALELIYALHSYLTEGLL